MCACPLYIVAGKGKGKKSNSMRKRERLCSIY